MKGFSVQSGVQFQIHIEGESWSQGDTLTGTVTPACNVILANGTDKKLKLKSEDAFQELEKANSSSWKFTLPLDARIADRTGSLYILYGNAEPITAMGQLKLNIIPHLHLRELVEVLKDHFKFVPKATNTGKKGFVEIKFDAPNAQGWASLDQLVVLLKRDKESIAAKFSFHRIEVDPAKGGLSSMKTLREFEATWSLETLIHDFNQRLNKDEAIAAIDNIIEQYRNTGWL